MSLRWIAGATVLSVAAAHDPSKAAADLMMYYSFDAASISGAIVTDQSGNRHDGSLVGAWGGEPGKFGQAARFSGNHAASEMKIPLSGAPAFGSHFSVSFWMNASDRRSSYVVHRGTQYNDQNSIVSNFGGPVVHLFGGGSGVWDASAMSLDAVGQWTNVVYTSDGITLRGYIDGSLVVDAAIGVNWASTGDLFLGSSNDAYGYGDNFAGLIDDFAIWDSAISQQLVAQLQSTPLSNLIAVPEIDPSSLGAAVATIVSFMGVFERRRRKRLC